MITVPGHPELTITGMASGEVACTLGGGTSICDCTQQLRRDGHVRITLTDVPWGRRPTRMTITAQRWSCTQGCRQPEPWVGIRAVTVAGHRPRMTARLVDLLTDRYLRGEPATTLAEWCGVTAPGLRLLLNGIVLLVVR